jgi:transcriptional regulator with XRE-family HTH domain
MDEPGALGGTTFADKLDGLFRRVLRPDGKSYSYDDVASAIQAAGTTISGSYIWQLRKGEKDNPTIKHVKALAEFFGVEPVYFFDDAATERITAQLDQLRAEQQRLQTLKTDDEAQLVAMRASELAPSGRALLMNLLDVVEQAQAAERGKNDPSA